MRLSRNKAIVILIFMIFAIIFALRPVDFDPDLEHYFRFWSSGSYPLTFEPGFVLLSKAFVYLVSVRGWLIVCTIFMLLVFALVYEKPYYVEKVLIAFFALAPTVFLIQVRFGVALAIFAVAMCLVRQPIKRLLILIVSVSIHYSMIIFIILLILGMFLRIAHVTGILLLSLFVFFIGINLTTLVDNLATALNFSDVRIDHYMRGIESYQRFNFLNLPVVAVAFFMFCGAVRIKGLQYVRIVSDSKNMKFLMLLVSATLTSSMISATLNFRMAMVVAALSGILLNEGISGNKKIKTVYQCLLSLYIMYSMNLLFFSPLFNWNVMF